MELWNICTNRTCKFRYILCNKKNKRKKKKLINYNILKISNFSRWNLFLYVVAPLIGWIDRGMCSNDHYLSSTSQTPRHPVRIWA